MKAIPSVLLLAGSLACCLPAAAQAPAPAPKMPDPGPLFRLPEAPHGAKPHFKFQIPPGGPFSVPDFTVVAPPRPGWKGTPDPGIFLKPRGFDQLPSQPASPNKIYPDLKMMPIEIANLDPAPAWQKFEPELIPRAWPRARLEPIPTDWKNSRLVPVDTGKNDEKPVR